MRRAFARATFLCQLALCCATGLSPRADAAGIFSRPAAVTRTQAELAVLPTANDPQAFFPFPPELLNAVKEATEANILLFAAADEFAPVRSVATAKPSPAGKLPKPALEKLRGQLLSPSSYQPATLGVACRFAPNYGFRFVGETSEAWWLVSERCKTGMLLGKDSDWRRSPALIIKPAALGVFKSIRGQGVRTE